MPKINSTLNQLINSSHGVAALAFAVSLGHGRPGDILAGAGARWSSPDGVRIQGKSGMREPTPEDFNRLRALAHQLQDYAKTLLIIADCEESEDAN